MIAKHSIDVRRRAAGCRAMRALSMIALSLVGSCDRSPRRNAPPLIGRGNVDAAPVSPPIPTEPAVACTAGWWPISPTAAWRFRIERTDMDPASGQSRRQIVEHTAQVTAVSYTAGATRIEIAGWPTPWRQPAFADLTVLVTGSRYAIVDGDSAPTPWFDLATFSSASNKFAITADGPVFTVVANSHPDDATLQLGCGRGPLRIEYHHHGSVQDLIATRIP
jgi:hypothetical protein